MSKHRKTAVHKVSRAVRARTRLLFCLAVGVIAFLVTPAAWRPETRALLGWDLGVFLYLVYVLRVAQVSTPDKIRLRARLYDDGALTTLFLSTLASVACFTAIAFELSAVKAMTGADKALHAVLVGVTIPAAWAFIHAMFAVHYAHEFYDAADSCGHGLVFPGDKPLTYWDFLYFSYIIGTSGQTADVSISCPSLRKIALVHCVLAFFFNITMLGLTINVASSLL